MSDVAPLHLDRSGLLGTPLRPEQVAAIVNAVISGGQFAGTLTRLNSTLGSVVFPVISAVDEPEWIPEFGVYPTLGLHGEPLVVVPAKIGGTALIPGELWDDMGRNLTVETENVLRSEFSRKVDRDLLAGSGDPAPTPTGILDGAAEVAAPSLWAGVIRAKGQLTAAGGSPSHVAMTADAIAAEEERVDNDGRPLYPDGLATFAGLTVVAVPAANPPLVYDSSRVFLVVRRDYTALLSDQYAPAFERGAWALRLDARMNIGVPAPSQAMRKLIIGEGNGGNGNGGNGNG